MFISQKFRLICAAEIRLAVRKRITETELKQLKVSLSKCRVGQDQFQKATCGVNSPTDQSGLSL